MLRLLGIGRGAASVCEIGGPLLFKGGPESTAVHCQSFTLCLSLSH